MRTQFFFVGLLSGVAGMLVGTAGCDNVTAGQSADTSAPPQLQHVMVQDARYLLAFPNRGSALDILDNNATRSCTISCKGNCPADPVSKMAPAQLDTCINEFLVDQVAPDVHCLASGVCNDPFKIPATGVPVPLTVAFLTGATDMRDPGGGIAIRLVFDKVLDNSIEMVTMDPTKAPGSTNTYTIAPGIIELDDSTGMAQDSVIYYDNGGSNQFSADLELVPLGPAIVIKPKSTLLASTKYTIKILNAGALKDREGNAATALGGGALPASLSFTTEALTPAANGAFGVSPLDYPDFTAGAATITPNEVVQIGFFEPFAGDSATVTIKSGCTGAKPIAYSDRGNDATMCTKADPGGYPILDIFNSTTGAVATGMPVDWPMGDCTLTVTVPSIDGSGAAFTADYTFTVMGTDETDPMVDPNIESQHVMPAECAMP
jgi:hypothetical protein